MYQLMTNNCIRKLYGIVHPRKFVIGILIAFLPLIAVAQSAGGQIKRPVQKHHLSTKSTKKDSKLDRKVNNKVMERMANRPSIQDSKTDAAPVNTQQQRILNNLIANMIYVQSGTFTMGGTKEQNTDKYSDDKPIHQVTLSSFHIGKYEVTQEEWETIMGYNPSHHKSERCPVEMVSWNEVQKFIKKLNLITGKHFRLPSEAEWEFAARGGNKTCHYKYAGSNNINEVSWYCDNSSNSTHIVGQKMPNELGLYDMSGNVSEWCSDYYGFYESNAQTNPISTSPGSINWLEHRGTDRIHRGGSFKDSFSISRRGSCPGESVVSGYLGFRLAM